MNLDINTERGQASLEYERKMLDRIRHMMCSKHKNNSALIETDKNMDAKIDGIIIKDNQISGIFESKCRNMSLMDLRNFGHGWLRLIKSWMGRNCQPCCVSHS